jgi:hypothetical protein
MKSFVGEGHPGRLAVFADVAFDARFQAAVARLDSVQVVDATMMETVRRLGGGGVLLMGASTIDGAQSIEAISALRQHLPHVIIVLCGETRRDFERVPRDARVGVDEFVWISAIDGVRELERIVTTRRTVPPPERELRVLFEMERPSWVGSAVLSCLRNAYRRRIAPERAGAMGYSEREVRDRFQKAGRPAPGKVARCGRFLFVAELEDLGFVFCHAQAALLGFDDSTALRKKKSELRRSVNSDEILAGFVSLFPRLQRTLRRGRA